MENEKEVYFIFEKRRTDVEFIKDKKLRLNSTDWEELSALERLPNEVYLMILNYANSTDEKNLRLTSKRLYMQSTQLSSIFQNWYINATDDYPLPQFVSTSEKKFHVHATFDSDYRRMPIAVIMVGQFIYRYSRRISKLSLTNTEGSVKLQDEMSALKQMKPSSFPNLIYLELVFCNFDNDSLLHLSAQLQTIIFHNLETEFDISTVSDDKGDKRFTKIKKLSFHDCKIDMNKMLTKCCYSLKYLDLSYKQQPFVNLDDFRQELTSIKSVHVTIKSKSQKLEQSVKALISRSGNLKTLNLQLLSNASFDFSILLEHNIDITTLSVYSGRNDVQEFLKKCPKLQKLTLRSYMKRINRLDLNDLVYLKLDHCSNKCLNSTLKQISMASALRTLDLTYLPHNWSESDIPVFPKLDLVSLLIRTQFYEEELEQAYKMFPSSAKVKAERPESSPNKTEIKQVYNI